jgi:hypothetical protein
VKWLGRRYFVSSLVTGLSPGAVVAPFFPAILLPELDSKHKGAKTPRKGDGIQEILSS